MTNWQKYEQEHIAALKTMNIDKYKKFVKDHEYMYSPGMYAMFMRMEDRVIKLTMAKCILSLNNEDKTLFTEQELQWAKNIQYN